MELICIVGNDPVNFSDAFGLERTAQRVALLRHGTIYGFTNGVRLIARGYKLYDCYTTEFVGWIPQPGVETDWGMQFAMAAPFAGLLVCGGAAAGEGTKVYQVWGDGARPFGRSWTTPLDPRSVANYRDIAGLPVQNSGRFVSEGVITNAQGCLSKEATSLAGNRGGLAEVVIPNAAKQVRLTRVSGANPPY